VFIAAVAAGAKIIFDVRFTGVRNGMARFANAEPVSARFIVGADGALSGVARELRLDTNRRN